MNKTMIKIIVRMIILPRKLLVFIYRSLFQRKKKKKVNVKNRLTEYQKLNFPHSHICMKDKNESHEQSVYLIHQVTVLMLTASYPLLASDPLLSRHYVKVTGQNSLLSGLRGSGTSSVFWTSMAFFFFFFMVTLVNETRCFSCTF